MRHKESSKAAEIKKGRSRMIFWMLKCHRVYIDPRWTLEESQEGTDLLMEYQIK